MKRIDSVVFKSRNDRSEERLAFVEAEMLASLRIKEKFVRECADTIAEVAEILANSIRRGGKLLLFGNGGSAADAQHIAAEFVGRYQIERQALPAIALTANSSTVTAVANDYGYEEVFARQIAAFGTPIDAAIAISTSGNSPSVLRGVAVAKSLGMITVGMAGNTGGKLKEVVDRCICVPSDVTARIQECHSLVGHVLSGYCEKQLAIETVAAAKG